MMKPVLKKAGHWLKNAFTKNLGMKIGALVFAFLLWSFVIADQNPVRERVFQDIPVTFVGTEMLRQRALTPTEALSDVLAAATVTVQANAERIYLLTEGMLSVEVDLSAVTEAGEKTLPVTAKSTMAGITIEVEPKDVAINVEPIVTQEVPVEVQLAGEKKGWLYYGEPIVSESTIEVTGARSNVERVARGVCYVDIGSLENYIEETRTVALLDENGEEMPVGLFTGIPSVIVELPIYPQKEVAIDIQNIEETATGLADGYEITGIEIDLQSVKVAGRLEDISQIDAVKLEPIVLDGLPGDQVVTAKVALNEGVYAVSPAEVQVRLKTLPQQDRQTYAAVDIDIKNLDERYTVSLKPESIDVDVSGEKTVLDALTADVIKPFVDLQGLGAGTHIVEVKFENEPDLGVSIIPSAGTVSVTIR